MKEDKINKNYLQIYGLYKLNKIEGSKKFEKVCFDLKDSLIKKGHSCGNNFEFKSDNFGPRDPGLSKANIKFEMMGVLEIKKELDKKSTCYQIKEKGKLWINSLTKFYRRTIPKFEEIHNIINSSLEENEYLSGTQITKKDNIQKAKKKLWDKKV